MCPGRSLDYSETIWQRARGISVEVEPRPLPGVNGCQGPTFNITPRFLKKRWNYRANYEYFVCPHIAEIDYYSFTVSACRCDQLVSHSGRARHSHMMAHVRKGEARFMEPGDWNKRNLLFAPGGFVWTCKKPTSTKRGGEHER